MFLKNAIKNLAITMASLGSVAITTPHSLVKAQGANFYCGTSRYEGNEIPATRVDIPGRGDFTFIFWTRDVFQGSSRYNRERCESAARNLENNSRAGNLVYMFPASHPSKDRYNVICAARTREELDWYTCPEERVLFEVHPDEDPTELVIRIGETSTGVDRNVATPPYHRYGHRAIILIGLFSRYLTR